MTREKTSGSSVAVRCFCGNSMSLNPRARRAVLCDKCHQPLPMKAIRMAVAARAKETTRPAMPLKRPTTVTA